MSTDPTRSKYHARVTTPQLAATPHQQQAHSPHPHTAHRTVDTLRPCVPVPRSANPFPRSGCGPSASARARSHPTDTAKNPSPLLHHSGTNNMYYMPSPQYHMYITCPSRNNAFKLLRVRVCEPLIQAQNTKHITAALTAIV
jgi:hypothetical protein